MPSANVVVPRHRAGLGNGFPVDLWVMIMTVGRRAGTPSLEVLRVTGTLRVPESVPHSDDEKSLQACAEWLMDSKATE